MRAGIIVLFGTIEPTHIHAHTHTNVHTHTQTQTPSNTHTHTHTHSETQTHTLRNTYRNTHTQKHTHTQTHTHTQRHTQTQMHTRTHHYRLVYCESVLWLWFSFSWTFWWKPTAASLGLGLSSRYAPLISSIVRLRASGSSRRWNNRGGEGGEGETIFCRVDVIGFGS